MANGVQEIAHRENQIGRPPIESSGSTYLIDLSMLKIRLRPARALENEIVDSEPLVFDNTAWEKRIDLRGMSVKELRWDSTNHPSEVRSVVDLREARIGTATVKEVRFQDLVDFSRMTVGQYGERIHGPPTKAQWEKQRAFGVGRTRKVSAWVNHLHHRPLMHFEGLDHRIGHPQ